MQEISAMDLPEFDQHHQVINVEDPEIGLSGFVAIHQNLPNIPSLGATRLYSYRTEKDALRDALRLSRLMSYKSALAGLPYTGAKATIVATHGLLQDRRKLFESYAKQVHELAGKFITGTDVGLSNDDVYVMREKTPYVVGTKVDPGYYTALGVLYGMQETIKQLDGSDDLAGKKVAIQGVGHTGGFLVQLLSELGAEIIMTDINTALLKKLKKEFPKAEVVEPTSIYDHEMDIFAPCAMGGLLNHNTVDWLKTRAIVGSANNQLANEDIGKLLQEHNILYAPDYVVNAGGLVSVADEYQHGEPDHDRIDAILKNIRTTLQEIYSKNGIDGRPSNMVANEMAEAIFEERAKNNDI